MVRVLGDLNAGLDGSGFDGRQIEILDMVWIC